MSISIKELNALYAKPAKKAPKYGNSKVKQDGATFDSGKEFKRWKTLELLQKAGAISNLRRQVAYVLAPSVKLDGKTKPALRYFADHVYIENGVEVVEDVKSAITRKCPAYRMKKHLIKHLYNIEIKEV